MSRHFVVGENGGSGIRELGCRDYLSKDALEAILKDKETRKELEVEWKGDVDDSSQAKPVLQRLRPHPHVECIKIVGYGGTEFPKWVGDASFSKLKKMLLSGCQRPICLPPLGQLPSLEELSIDGYDGLAAIGMEFYGSLKSGETPFLSLKRLKFVGMKNWEEWSFIQEFPVLEELELRDCPKLESLPNHFPSLKELVLRDCSNLKSLRSTRRTGGFLFSPSLTCPMGRPQSLFPALQELELHNCPKLMSFPSDLPGLKGLRIEDCPKLNFENLSISTCATLETIRIHSYSKLVSFPTGELHAPKLKEIDLSDCGNLKSLPRAMHSQLPSLKKLSISNCPEIESSPEGGLPPELESLEIDKCEKLEFVVGENGGPIINALGKLHSLRGEISFRMSENVNNDGVVSEAILKGEVNLKMLKLSWNGDANSSRQVKQVLKRLQPHIQMEYIWIRSCSGKELLDWVRGISFSELKEMRLDGCDNCFCLPPLRQLASLEKLSINCTRMVIGLEFHGACKPWEKPFKSLKTLEIRGTKNRREWSFFNGAFPVLEELELCDCPKLMSVHINLSRLKRLRISGCGQLDFENLLISARDTLETIDIRDREKEKCLKISPETFPNLKELVLRNWSNLESLRTSDRRFSYYHRRHLRSYLEELELRDCPKLMSVPINLPRLKRLRISGCGRLDFDDLISKCYSLETVDIRGSEKVEFLTSRGVFAGSVTSLSIWGCPNLVTFGRGRGFFHSLEELEELELRDCPKLLSVPINLPRLKRLRISGCGQLRDFERLLFFVRRTLKTIDFRDSEKVKCIRLETFPNLKVFEVRNFSNLKSLGSTAAGTSDSLPSCSLTSLTIHRCPELVSFPRGGLDAPNMTSMCLNGCPNLESLPQGMQRLLPSLEKLSISCCPKIESLPDGGLPSTLSSLHIRACGSLREKCRGEYGPMIQHIPDLVIE